MSVVGAGDGASLEHHVVFSQGASLVSEYVLNLLGGRKRQMNRLVIGVWI